VVEGGKYSLGINNEYSWSSICDEHYHLSVHHVNV